MLLVLSAYYFLHSHATMQCIIADHTYMYSLISTLSRLPATYCNMLYHTFCRNGK